MVHILRKFSSVKKNNRKNKNKINKTKVVLLSYKTFHFLWALYHNYARGSRGAGEISGLAYQN